MRSSSRLSRGMWRVACLTFFCAIAAVRLHAAGADGKTPPHVLTLEGTKTNVFGGGKILALLFVSTHCPIANASSPEIRKIWERFSPQGVEFSLIYPDPDDTPDLIREHLREFSLPCVALRDPTHGLATFTGAAVTPEAAVYSATGRQLYLGRIDDRSAALGKLRPKITSHDLEQALAEITAGRAPTQRITRAIGCYIEDLK